jgi:hypothetical protein
MCLISIHDIIAFMFFSWMNFGEETYQEHWTHGSNSSGHATLSIPWGQISAINLNMGK